MLKPNSAGIGKTFRPNFGRIFGRKGQSDLPNSGEFCQFRLDFSGTKPNSAGNSGLFGRKCGQNSAGNFDTGYYTKYSIPKIEK